MKKRSSTRQKLERLAGGSRSRTSEAGTRQDPPSSSPGLESLYRLEQEVLGEDTATGAELSVKQRLERLVEAKKETRPSRPQRQSFDVEAQAVTLEEVLDGKQVENDHGAYYLVENVFPLDHHQGKINLSRLEQVSPSAFSILARGDDELDLDLTRAVFLDTETTGLAGGAGTCPFLIGCGYIDEDQFIVRQFFMRDYAEEEAMLHDLAGLVSRFVSLVTFNGKSFDVPLLESRYVLARFCFPLAETPHFDLLHPARSLWKARLESCRLTELETILLGLERQGDVPGALIPGLYFDYLRSRDASRIHSVFSHNCHDILSLAALTVYASEALDEDCSPEHPMDDYSLGRIFERAAIPERSMQHYSRAVESGLQGTAKRRSLQQLAWQHKRRDDWDEATKLWRELAGEDGTEAFQALEELAMQCEHRDRDFRAALEYCHQAISRIEDDFRLPLDFRERRREAFLHRRRRLERKLGKL